MKFALYITMVVSLGCASTVRSSRSAPPPNDVGFISADAGTNDVAPDQSSAVDSGTPDVAVHDAGQDVPTDTRPDVASDVESDSGIRWPVTATISRVTPPSRFMPRNATGVFFAAFDFTSTGAEVPQGLLRLRRVGVGPATDIANVYDYGITSGSVAETPFRYSAGRGVNPMTNEITIPFAGVREGATTTHLIYVDLGSATIGAQHALELVGVTLNDGSPDGLFVPFTGRSNPITISADLAGRLDVQRGTVSSRVNVNVSGEAIGSCRLRANRHDLDLVRFSFANGGNVMAWSEIRNLELWRGSTRIPISEWMDPLNGYIVLSPITPIYLPAGAEAEFVILARVSAPTGRTIRLFLEYPTDIHVIDRALNTPAAVCIASTTIGGCEGPNQGSFDGMPGNATETVVLP